MTASGVAAVRSVAAGIDPVGLAELNTRAELMRRSDRKYLMTGSAFVTMMGLLAEVLAGDLQVLEIDGERVMGYESVYYDSPDLAGYRAHVQGRRRRFKVRSRSYLETGVSFVEVKYKSRLNVTSKVRTAYPDAPPVGQSSLHPLAEHGVAFAGDVLSEVYALTLPDRIDPVLRTTNGRATFLVGAYGATPGGRMTVDVALRFDDGANSSSMHEDLVLIETKSDGGSLVVDHLLLSLRERPVLMSKYCVGLSLLRPDVSGNKWRRLTRTYFAAA